ncbi:aminotransferase class V-fold PLP-dependent enzyme [Vitreoscilla massiliensis]|uniref:Aminotransferase class V-fold PLP-dependent enzyme n=1 Tax=Vitreoscilla massiliensis TaxID=1689272 RepID=A0ABY4E4G3_9NEIS|nr:GNAT family N-acyltransferase [Vitreoscilla massiliensis]UOO90631.1 aminotransferase class V-fold PLP-dependent enzyme [Vitreoscilla massiliensis]
MYHCKIADTVAEFTAIARLNYATFVEEIPQHPANAEKLLVDKFHAENTYVVLYQDDELIAMLAFRDVRPFSLDGKIGAIEQHLDAATCRKLCEIRLLAVQPEHRHSFVFLRLAQALYVYVLDKNYSACVISGTTRQQKLYHHIGFQAFAPAVGTAAASFIPMVLNAIAARDFYAQFQRAQHCFYPGPVAQTSALSHTHVSHRSAEFTALHSEVCSRLLKLSGAPKVALLLGSGTLANEVMLNQLKAKHGTAMGLICSNGEFGTRLIQQARALGLRFRVYEVAWGQVFDAQDVAEQAQDCAWLAAVHGETSTGCLNDVALFSAYKAQRGGDFSIALDCVSSFGAVPFSLAEVDFASATSGKAIGALAGLSWVFYQQAYAKLAEQGTYAQLAHYDGHIPFTLPAYLLANVCDALVAYPERYTELAQRLHTLLHHPLLQAHCLHTNHYPTAVSYQFPSTWRLNTELNGLHLHQHSTYLQARACSQISTIQPTFAQDFAALSAWLAHTERVIDAAVSV